MAGVPGIGGEGGRRRQRSGSDSPSHRTVNFFGSWAWSEIFVVFFWVVVF